MRNPTWVYTPQTYKDEYSPEQLLEGAGRPRLHVRQGLKPPGDLWLRLRTLADQCCA